MINVLIERRYCVIMKYRPQVTTDMAVVNNTYRYTPLLYRVKNYHGRQLLSVQGPIKINTFCKWIKQFIQYHRGLPPF